VSPPHRDPICCVDRHSTGSIASIFFRDSKNLILDAMPIPVGIELQMHLLKWAMIDFRNVSG
jgi:hypothetical protein